VRYQGPEILVDEEIIDPLSRRKERTQVSPPRCFASLQKAKCVLQMNSSCLDRLPRSGRVSWDPNPTKVQDEYLDVTTGWFVPLHFKVALSGNIRNLKSASAKKEFFREIYNLIYLPE